MPLRFEAAERANRLRIRFLIVRFPITAIFAGGSRRFMVDFRRGSLTYKKEELKPLEKMYIGLFLRKDGGTHPSAGTRNEW